MPIEKRTRVEIFIPLRSDLTAYQSITEFLAEEFAFTRGGSTLTVPFSGLYASDTQVGIIHDAIRILFCDFDFDLDNPKHKSELIDYLESVRHFLLHTLEEEEVWIVYHSVTRVLS
jgi:hypothetical protein